MADRRIDKLHPDLQAAIGRIMAILEGLGHPMLLTDGYRTAKEQADLYAIGRSKPGKVVTHKNGTTNPSIHQSGKAADLTFLHDGKPCWCDQHPWQLYGELAKVLGLTWGGSWKGLVDKPHIELKA